jgi:hypothetical protein
MRSLGHCDHCGIDLYAEVTRLDDVTSSACTVEAPGVEHTVYRCRDRLRNRLADERASGARAKVIEIVAWLKDDGLGWRGMRPNRRWLSGEIARRFGQGGAS